jgi:hypothetical protein
MNYETATVEEIAEHFGKISRQRVSQLTLVNRRRGNDEVVAKMQQATVIVRAKRKAERKAAKVRYNEAAICRLTTVWNGVSERVGVHPAYLECKLEFASLDAFRTWAMQQKGWDQPDFELDKDILRKGNKIYGPATCVFVPAELNSLLSGCYRAKRRGKYPIGVCYNKGSGTFIAQMSKDRKVSLDKYLGSFKTVEEAFACYKQAKEAKIKRLAEKWRDHIDIRAYEALMARTVEWDD